MNPAFKNCLKFICICIWINSRFTDWRPSLQFPVLWFPLQVSWLGNNSGFSANVDRMRFFSLKRPELETLTCRPFVAVLSTMRSRRALNWLSSGVPVVLLIPGAVSALLLYSGGTSYNSLASDFFLRRKVSFHQAGAGSAVAMAKERWALWRRRESGGMDRER